MNTIKGTVVLMLLSWSGFISLHAQTITTISDSLSLDHGIRYGRLPNGFTYYIKSLSTPQPNVYMRLFIKAGSNQEDDDQWQMAHFMEHMSFRKTKNFPSGFKTPDLLNTLNMQSYDINGGTHGSYTSYNFDYPTGNAKALDSGFLFFHDLVSGHVNFKNGDIDYERKAFFQEYAFRDGKNNYTDNTLKSILSQCGVAQVRPKVYKEYVQTFKSEPLIRYYKDWYHPELSALVIVGNIADVYTLEKNIQKRFADIKPNPNPRKRQECNLEYFKRPEQFIVLEEPEEASKAENDAIVVRSFIRNHLVDKKTWEGLKWNLVKSLFQDMLNLSGGRFWQSMQGYNIPYKIYCGFSIRPSAMEVRVTSNKGAVEKGVHMAFSLLRGIKDDGFSMTEWKKARQARLEAMDKISLENPNYWIEHIANHYVEGEALPKQKTVFLRDWLSRLTLKEFNNMVKEFIKDMPEDIAIIAPAGNKALSYKENQIRQWVRDVYEGPIPDYMIKDEPVSLMDVNELSSLYPTTNTSEVMLGVKAPGIWQLRLDNGTTIVLQTSKASGANYNEKIKLHGFSPRGASCFSKRDYFSAISAPDIVLNTGVADLDKFSLGYLLSNTSMPYGVRPYIDYNETGIKGEATLEDLEKMLQLVYLYFTSPRKDVEAFKDWKSLKERKYLNPPYDIDNADLKDVVLEVLKDSSMIPTGTKYFKGIKYTDLDRSYEIYNGLYSNASDFTFLIDGDFSIKEVLPLIRKYLGSLPAISNNVSCENRVIFSKPQLKGPVYQEVNSNGTIGNNLINIHYVRKVEAPHDWREQIKIDVLGKIIGIKLNELRYLKNRGIYLCGATDYSNKLLQRSGVSLFVACANNELELVLMDIKEIIKGLKDNWETDSIFRLAITHIMSKYTIPSRGRQNKLLYNYYRYGDIFIGVGSLKTRQFMESLTPNDIINTARKFLKDEYLFECILKNKNDKL